MKKSLRFLVILFLLVNQHVISNAQNEQYARRVLYQLCSPEMHGRGYYKQGDRIAADYLASEMKKLGVKTFGEEYLQPYTVNVNVTNRLMVKLNGQELKFSKDFVVTPYSASVKGTFTPVMVNASLMKNPDKLLAILQETAGPKVVLIDTVGLKNPPLYQFVKSVFAARQFGVEAIIDVLSTAPVTVPGRWQTPYAHLQIARQAIPENLQTVELDVEADYQEKYPTQNVIGWLPGKTEDFIVFTAHYDGFGSFGEGNYYQAAQDNGSGTAMVLDLARHYAKGKKPHYSVAFMLFSGEEIGLTGSTWYANNPLFPLDKIKLVINLDMVATGQDGVFLFNAENRPSEAALVMKINEEHGYMKSVDNREGRANSDHWPFHLKGVPAIFFLTKGACGDIHKPGDTYDKVPFYAYSNLFKLVLKIPEELERQEIR